MDSDYIKQLEDDNQKLREKLESEQIESDKYKGYVDLISKGEVTRYHPYGDSESLFHFLGVLPRGSSHHQVVQRIKIVLKCDDFDNFPILHEKIDEYIRERHRLRSVEEENEIKREKRKKILFVSAIVIGSGLVLWGLGYAIWWAYFVTL